MNNVSLGNSKIFSNEKLVYCSVCLDEIPFSKSIELSCHHRFCSECLSREWEYSIMNGNFSPERLKCPNDKCTCPITYYELKTLLKPEVFKRYEDNSIKHFQTQKNNPEIVVMCPNPNCQINYMVSRKLSYFQCQKCNFKYCIDCFGEWSKHEGLKCQEFKESNISKEEREFMAEIKKKKWMHCPECKTIIEKIEFCNFIRCTSPICQKKTCFCYLCGQKLTHVDHFNHFVDKNPYGNVCINSNESSKTEILMGKCPICGAKDNEICEFLSNFNNKICFCKSEKCKNRYVCLRCREYLDEKALNKHLDQQDFDCTKISKCSIF